MSQAHGNIHYREQAQGITPEMEEEARQSFASTAALLEEVALSKLKGRVSKKNRKLLEEVVQDARQMMRRSKP